MILGFRFHPIRFPVGAAFTALTAGIRAYSTELLSSPFDLILGGLFLVIGVVLILSGCMSIRSAKIRIIPKWREDLVEHALKNARKGSLVRILQTWLPNNETFCYMVHELLTRGGINLRFQILLMNPGDPDDNTNDILSARIKLRHELYREKAQQDINMTIKTFTKCMEEVNEAWAKRLDNGRVNFEIRLYDFLPFGPIYQIGDEVMFVGFYINYKTSAEAPMVVIKDNSSRIWKEFEEDLNRGWNDAKPLD